MFAIPIVYNVKMDFNPSQYGRNNTLDSRRKKLTSNTKRKKKKRNWYSSYRSPKKYGNFHFYTIWI